MPGDLIDKCRLTCHTFENNFEFMHKYFKEKCGQGSDQHFSIKYFLINDLSSLSKPSSGPMVILKLTLIKAKKYLGWVLVPILLHVFIKKQVD